MSYSSSTFLAITIDIDIIWLVFLLVLNDAIILSAAGAGNGLHYLEILNVICGKLSK